MLCVVLLRYRHTSRSAASQFESVLEVWETAAAAVLQREAILAQVLQIQSALSQHQQYQQQQIHWYNIPQLSFGADSTADLSSTAAGGCGQEFGPLCGLTVQQVSQVCWAYLAAEQQLQLAADRLLEVTEEQLLVDCCAYPAEDSRLPVEQLKEMLVEAWVATGSGSS
jgi:hypothetical protein